MKTETTICDVCKQIMPINYTSCSQNQQFGIKKLYYIADGRYGDSITWYDICNDCLTNKLLKLLNKG